MTQAAFVTVMEMPGGTAAPSGGALPAWLDNPTPVPPFPPLETRIGEPVC